MHPESRINFKGMSFAIRVIKKLSGGFRGMGFLD
jgi:hypothetical protein